MLKYMRKYWIFAVLAAGFMIAEVTVDMMQPKLMAEIVDKGILGAGNGGVPDIALIKATGFKMLLIVLAGGVCGMLSGTASNICSQGYGNRVRKAAFERIMRMSFQQTDDFTTGSLITRVTNDISQIERLVSQLVRGFIRCLMFMVVGSFTLLSLNAKFLTVIVIAFPLVLLDVFAIMWKVNPLFDKVQSKLDRMNTVIQEDIKGVRVIKAFIQEKHEQSRFNEANEDQLDTQFRVLMLMAYMRPIMNIILNLATVGLIYIGGAQVKAGAMLPGEVMAGVTYISQILSGMMMLAMIFQTLSRGRASAKRLREVLDCEAAIVSGAEKAEAAGSPDEPEKPEALRKGSSIEFKAVGFTYPGGDNPEVLDSVDLNIAPGETVAVIGATGSGKTTLANLIDRLYDVTEGSVKIDGVDVRDYDLTALRNKISFVTQKSELFSTTIRDNITLGKPDATDEEMISAAEVAQAHEFISEQPDGYDTVVAEGGMSLSGGQRQRISISRALLKECSILILDDATSALDLRTEAALYDALGEKYRGITKFVIAQRISTVKRADSIAVLAEGTIVATGTHEELLESCEEYRSIADSQMKKGGAA